VATTTCNKTLKLHSFRLISIISDMLVISESRDGNWKLQPSYVILQCGWRRVIGCNNFR